MKSAFVCALIASLAAQSASLAAQERTWSKVRNWRTGAEVTVRTSHPEPIRRHFIRADDDEATLLNLFDPALPSDVAKLLRRTIVEHPDYFPAPEGKTFQLDSRVSLGADGLFVAGQKIAEYDQVVERILRADVEGGAVSLEVKRGWSTSKQILVTLGAVWAAGALIAIIGTAGQP
jgi:hypothetical protein